MRINNRTLVRGNIQVSQNMLPTSVDHSPWEANNHLASQDITQFYGTRRHIIASIALGYGLDNRGEGSIPGGGWGFFYSSPRPERLWGLPSLLFNGY